jgi:hypothetical protein
VLLGVRRDPVYGATLTLGFGGVTAELLADTRTLVLPVAADEVWEAVKASPGQAWNAAASVLSGLPEAMPDLPSWWDYLVSIDWTPWN